MNKDRAALIARYRKARRDQSLAVLEGLHAIKHAWRFGADITHCASDDRSASLALATAFAGERFAAFLGKNLEAVSSDCFDELAPKPHDTRTIAIANRAEIQPQAGPIVLLEEPRHLGNIGAVIRVGAGLGAGSILMIGPVDPWHPTIIRAAAGLHFALPVRSTTLEDIEASSSLILAFDPDGLELRNVADQLIFTHHDPPGSSRPGLIQGSPDDRPVVLAFGSERHGLSSRLLALASQKVAITMRDGVSSLNLATSVAIALHSLASADRV